MASDLFTAGENVADFLGRARCLGECLVGALPHDPSGGFEEESTAEYAGSEEKAVSV